MATPTRFWIEFDDTRETPEPGVVVIDDSRAARLAGGCGVTAWDLDDALDLIAAAFADWSDEPLPPVLRVIPDIDVGKLPKHVADHGLGVVVWRGVWHPPFNLFTGPSSR